MNLSRGTLVRWIQDKHFGFIKPDDGSADVFVHLRDFGTISRSPQVGDAITYQPLSDGRGRLRAGDVHIEGLARGRHAHTSFQSGSKPTAKQKRPRRVSNNSSLRNGFAFAAAFLCGVAAATVSGWIPVEVLSLYLGASILTFAVYAYDKSSARNGRWRVQEGRLHLLGLVGGWPGALIAQRLFRHKSAKMEFLVVFWLSVVVNCAGVFLIFSDGGLDVLKEFVSRIAIQ